MTSPVRPSIGPSPTIKPVISSFFGSFTYRFLKPCVFYSLATSIGRSMSKMPKKSEYCTKFFESNLDVLADTLRIFCLLVKEEGSG